MSNIKPTIHKIVAYITHQQRLLVFEQPDSPEAGIQVPAGTLEYTETPQQGVLREACEETGLKNLTVDVFLGEQIRDVSDYGKNEVHHRHIYHLIAEGEVPEKWEHFERYSSDKGKTPVRFAFYWVTLPDGVTDLISDFGNKLPQLIAHLGLES